jgi:hypothetical protein
MRMGIPQDKTNATQNKYVVPALVAVETILVSMAMLPPQVWSRILPTVGGATLNGPFPATIAPLITIVIYLLPTVIGFLNRHWQRALLYATIPAWVGLGVFLIASTVKQGAFYVVSADRILANVSVLQLFVALGGIGWLARHFFKMS